MFTAAAAEDRIDLSIELLARFRLQEAAERLIRESDLCCASRALDLGYADQAHFTRDFRSVVGMPPEAYRRSHDRPSRGQ
ncbi:MAG: helix-turn-helix domain-containing protein [Spirochaetaceae bacterium]|nr:helix-turn-helix domain-containing protein [Spirochaetaceae bacterium]